MNPFNRAVYAYLKTVPQGKVVTYGQVARAIGAPRASRQVGRALHVNPQPGIIPCHRVVFRDGSLAPAFAFGGMQIQAELLRSEGVEVKDCKVDLAKYGWKE
ncbi:MAG: MGMT family protein [Clostridia bacterium]|nr:MGMT family protein [Clostridia bacterium]